jgi:tripartite-type tricarboxylate transporter receptor subunit TctC
MSWDVGKLKCLDCTSSTVYILHRNQMRGGRTQRVVVVGEGEIVKYIYSSITSVDINDLCPVCYVLKIYYCLLP